MPKDHRKDKDESISRLEGRNDTFGGLIIKKKKTDDGEKSTREERSSGSILGLDKLAVERRRERKRDGDETPGYLSESVRGKIDRYKSEKYRGDARGIVADSREKEKYRRDDRDGDRYGSNERQGDKESRRSSYRRDDGRRDIETPKFKVPDTPSRSVWDEEDRDSGKRQRSQWDTPTPGGRGRDSRGTSERSVGSLYESERRHRDERRRRGALEESVRSVKEGNVMPTFETEEERLEWEAEQKQIEREWYDNEEGAFDEEYNPFAKVSEEFVQKKEKQWQEKTAKPRLTVRQQQIKRDNEMWENNRLHRSGVVMLAGDQDMDFDEHDADRVNLLVHNIVPPFLDGRIVFTKQSAPGLG